MVLFLDHRLDRLELCYKRLSEYTRNDQNLEDFNENCQSLTLHMSVFPHSISRRTATTCSIVSVWDYMHPVGPNEL